MASPVVPLALAVQLLTIPCVHQEAPPPDEAERRAVADLMRVGAYVHRTTTREGKPSNSVSMYHLRADEDLDLLAGLPFLEHLTVSGNLTDAGVERIARLSGLIVLTLERAPLTDQTLAHIGTMTGLQNLTIRNAPVTDAGLVRLGGLTNLGYITLHDTQVTDAGVADLREALPYAIISRYESPGEPWGLYGVAAGLVVLAVGSIRCGLKGRMPGRSRLWTATAVVGLVALPGVSLLALKGMMRPLRDGDAAQFWFHATTLDLGARGHSFGGFYRARDGWFIGYHSGFHGRDIYRVHPDAVRALFPKVVERLRNAPPGRLRSDVELGFRAWERSGGGPDDVEGLLQNIEDARTTRIRRDNPARNYSPDEYEREFDDQWKRANRYSWNLWFEFVFLGGLLVFAAWPWLRAAGRTRWTIHLGLTPALFCLPFWLGYAPLAFTSAGTSGGVLYPWLLRGLRGLPWSELDTMILRSIPRPLEPLSQLPGPIMSISGGGAVGPVAVLTVSGLLVSAILGVPALRRWFIFQREKAGTLPPPGTS